MKYYSYKKLLLRTVLICVLCSDLSSWGLLAFPAILRSLRRAIGRITLSQGDAGVTLIKVLAGCKKILYNNFLVQSVLLIINLSSAFVCDLVASRDIFQEWPGDFALRKGFS